MTTSLAQYLQKTGMSQQAFAKLINRPPSCVSRWLSGRVRPSPLMFEVFERVTDGAVNSENWNTCQDKDK